MDFDEQISLILTLGILRRTPADPGVAQFRAAQNATAQNETLHPHVNGLKVFSIFIVGLWGRSETCGILYKSNSGMNS